MDLKIIIHVYFEKMIKFFKLVKSMLPLFIINHLLEILKNGLNKQQKARTARDPRDKVED